ncbi:hypothetical protein D3C85_1678350 [compost metagenome]
MSDREHVAVLVKQILSEMKLVLCRYNTQQIGNRRKNVNLPPGAAHKRRQLPSRGVHNERNVEHIAIPVLMPDQCT